MKKLLVILFLGITSIGYSQVDAIRQIRNLDSIPLSTFINDLNLLTDSIDTIKSTNSQTYIGRELLGENYFLGRPTSLIEAGGFILSHISLNTINDCAVNQATSGTTLINAKLGQRIKFGLGGVEGMTYKNNRLGINNNDPSFGLDVTASSRFRTNAGNVIIQDLNGDSTTSTSIIDHLNSSSVVLGKTGFYTEANRAMGMINYVGDIAFFPRTGDALLWNTDTIATRNWVIANTGGSGGGSGIKSIGANFGITVTNDSIVGVDTTEIATPFDISTKLDSVAQDPTPELGGDLNGQSLYDLIDIVNADIQGYIDMTPTAAPAHAEARMYYDSTKKAYTYYNDESDVAINMGQENVLQVRNTTGATITNGQAVYVSGAQGSNLPLVALAQADSLSTARCIGLATHDIENNSNGYVTTIGTVSDVATSAFTAGDPLFLSTTTAGALTATRPTTGFAVLVGYVTISNVSAGEIKVLPGTTVQESDLVIQTELDSAVISQSSIAVTGRNLAVTDAGQKIYNTTATNDTITIPTGLVFNYIEQKVDFEPYSTGDIVLDCSLVTVTYRSAKGTTATLSDYVTIIQGATLVPTALNTYTLIGSFEE